MGEVNPEESLEIGRGVFQATRGFHRLGDRVRGGFDCPKPDRPRLDRRAGGRIRSGVLTIARRFFADAADAERDFVAYRRWLSSLRKRACATGEGQGLMPAKLAPAAGIRPLATDRSIYSSIRRFISTAYSVGSFLTIGSTKPLTKAALSSPEGGRARFGTLAQPTNGHSGGRMPIKSGRGFHEAWLLISRRLRSRVRDSRSGQETTPLLLLAL